MRSETSSAAPSIWIGKPGKGPVTAVHEENVSASPNTATASS